MAHPMLAYWPVVRQQVDEVASQDVAANRDVLVKVQDLHDCFERF